MPRAVKDLSTYTHVGNYNWKEAIAEGRGVGVQAVALSPEMLLPEGIERDISNSNSQTYVTVHYDKDFLHEYLHKKFILAVGFMRHDEFNEEGFDRFMQEQKEYSRAESKRNAEADIIRMAAELAGQWGNTTEYWLETLKNGIAQKEQEKSPTPGANGSRAKVKA